MEALLVDKIKMAGIVGAGGAGFPTHVKVNAKAEYLVINGAECEPLLQVDQQLMHLKSNELLEGIKLVMEEIGAKKCVIALKKKYKKAIIELEKKLSNYSDIELLKMDNFYPAGDEQITVYEATGRIVPEGGIPLNVGVVVLNVETVINIHDAALLDKPVTHKYVTVIGEVKDKKTLYVPIGITVKELIELAGGTTIDNYAVINGGPMMGKIIDTSSKVSKTTKGIIVLPKDHSLVTSLSMSMDRMLKVARTACMNCSLCTEVCPRNLIGHELEPHKIIRSASYGDVIDSKADMTNAFLCCECRLCEYACVMDLQPWKLHGFLKGKMANHGIKNTHNKKPEAAHPFREYKKFPIQKLVRMLGIDNYLVDAPIKENNKEYEFVEIPLKQHIGAPSIPVVKIGEKVLIGQVIADLPEGKLGAVIHSSINGIVEEITNKIRIRRI